MNSRQDQAYPIKKLDWLIQQDEHENEGRDQHKKSPTDPDHAHGSVGKDPGVVVDGGSPGSVTDQIVDGSWRPSSEDQAGCQHDGGDE